MRNAATNLAVVSLTFTSPVWAADIDEEPDTARLPGDPSFLPVAGQISGSDMVYARLVFALPPF